MQFTNLLFIFFVQKKNATKKILNHDHMFYLNIDVKRITLTMFDLKYNLYIKKINLFDKKSEEK